MTGQAILLDRRVLEEVRAALFRMTAPALHVERLVFDHCVALRAVRIVAARACDLAFHDRVVRRFVDLHPDLLVAADTGLVFELALRVHERADRRIAARDCQGGTARGRGVHRVAIVAAHIVAAMAAGLPEREVPVACVTAHAGRGLLLRRDRALAETHGVRILRGIEGMVWIIPVARRTGSAAPKRGSGIPFRPVLGFQYAGLVFVAGQALLRVGLGECRAILRGEQEDEKQKSYEGDCIRTTDHAPYSLRRGAAYAVVCSGLARDRSRVSFTDLVPDVAHFGER